MFDRLHCISVEQLESGAVNYSYIIDTAVLTDDEGDFNLTAPAQPAGRFGVSNTAGDSVADINEMLFQVDDPGFFQRLTSGARACLLA